jgi:hypothetical protein
VPRDICCETGTIRIQTRLADLGGSLPSKDERTPAKFSGFVKAEIARWSPILKAASTEGK